MTFEQTLRQIVREEIQAAFDARKIPGKLSPQLLAESEGWLVTEVAEIYSGYKPETLRRLARSGKIQAEKAPGSNIWRFRASDIDDYIRRNRQTDTPRELLPEVLEFRPLKKTKTIL